MNTTTANGAASASATLWIYPTTARAVASALTGEKIITARFRAPAREAAIILPADVWAPAAAIIASTPPPYNQLIEGALISAAKAILARTITNAAEAKATLNDIPVSLLTLERILDEASGAANDWLTKEELEAAWHESATKAAIYKADRYANDANYRRAYSYFESLVFKLAGKTSAYTPADLDALASKLVEVDHATPFGSFVLKRIEQLRSKPVTAAVDMDVL